MGGFLKVAELCEAALRYHSYSLLNWRVRCEHGTTVLHNAVSQPSALRVILNKGAPIETIDSAGWTAFHYACWIGKIKSMELLLDKSPELLHHKDSKGRTPLHVACHGLPKSTLLLEAGNDLAPLRNVWWTKAFKDVTADERWREAMRSLPHPRTPPIRTRSAFDWKSQYNTVEWLIQRGAEVLVSDERGNYPIAYAAGVDTVHTLVLAAVREGLF